MRPSSIDRRYTTLSKNNNQAKDVSSLDNPDNSSSSVDTLLAVRESSVIRGKERLHEFMNRQELLFERFSRREPSGFEQVKEIFDIDSIDIPKQAVNQVGQMNQVKQSIRRPRGRPPGRERERGDREDYRGARDGARNDARGGARGDARGDAADVHMKDVTDKHDPPVRGADYEPVLSRRSI